MQSTADIRDRLIFALDVPNYWYAKRIIRELGDSVQFYKIGLEMAMTKDYFPLLYFLMSEGKKVFVDLKLFDVPKTVERALRRLVEYQPTFITIHGQSAEMISAACKNKGEAKILAVTVLTSIGDSAIQEEYGRLLTAGQIVTYRAGLAIRNGCDGIVCSGLEAQMLRRHYPANKFLIVCPGIRPATSLVCNDDQKRITTPTDALRSGADFIVVGRPIRDATDRRAAAEAIQDEIALFYSDNLSFT